jgi:hypothetical protein
MKLSSHKTVHRTYFLSKYSVSYTSRFSVPQTVKTAFVCSSLRTVIPVAVVAGGELRNLKGKEGDGSPTEGETGDLVLRLSGVLPLSQNREGIEGDSSSNEDEDEPVLEPWSIGSFSVFKEFRGAHDIVYECHPHATLHEKALRDLGTFLTLSEAEVYHFELYIEIFSSRFLSSLLGFAPSVLQTISIVSTNDELTLTLRHEQLSSPGSFPLSQKQFKQALQELFIQYFQIDIVEDVKDASVAKGD